MQKKKRDLDGLKIKSGGLLSPEEITAKTAEITRQPAAEPEPILEKTVRKKFTTMLNPKLTERLQIAAARQKCSAADIIERALEKYLDAL